MGEVETDEQFTERIRNNLIEYIHSIPTVEKLTPQFERICQDIDLVELFHELQRVTGNDLIIYKYLMFFTSEIPGQCNYRGITIQEWRETCKPSMEYLTELMYAIEFGKISLKDAKREYWNQFPPI